MEAKQGEAGREDQFGECSVDVPEESCLELSHGQWKCQCGALGGGSFIDEMTDIYFTPTMNQALYVGERDIFACHLCRLSYNYLFFIKSLLFNRILLCPFYGASEKL